MYKNKTGYPIKELVSRVFTGAHLPFNFNPKYLSKTNDTELFFNIGYFNYNLFLIENNFLNKFEFIAELKFEENFKNAISYPTEKTKKASDFYPSWFKMCCHLKFLLKEEGLEFFKLFSSLSGKYNEKECEKFYKNCEPSFGSIPGIFSIIDKYKPSEPELNRRKLIKQSFFKN